MHKVNKLLFLALIVTLLFTARAAMAAGAEPHRFDFGPGDKAPGYTQVLPTTVYTPERGYGFEPGTVVTGVDRGGRDPLRGDFITSDRPFFFSVQVPAEGNYRVTVTLGDAQGETTTTIKAELRRLMVERVHTKSGEFATAGFIVNTRTPMIAATDDIPAGEVRLKARVNQYRKVGRGTTGSPWNSATSIPQSAPSRLPEWKCRRSSCSATRPSATSRVNLFAAGGRC